MGPGLPTMSSPMDPKTNVEDTSLHSWNPLIVSILRGAHNVTVRLKMAREEQTAVRMKTTLLAGAPLKPSEDGMGVTKRTAGSQPILG